jgi:hypothetical protein|tara:strand:+ start:690 stop:1901 length:1212 start_codon:yes stop_codon:yes gene_type:complete
MVQLQNLIAENLKQAQNVISNVSNNENVIMKIILIFIIIIIITLILLLQNTLSLQKYNCKKLNNLYRDGSLPFNATSLSNNRNMFYNSRFKDLFTMTAYNCCNGGNYKNDFVDLCALDKCIKLGVRCLDFQVFSLNNNPIVSSSMVDTNYVKETYNYLNLDKVLDFIRRNAFKPDIAPNNDDPLILHIRVMSDNPLLYNNLLNIYKYVFSRNPNIDPYTEYNITLNENENRIFEKKILSLTNKIVLIIKPFNNFNLNNINIGLRKYINLESIDSNSSKEKDNNKCILYYTNRTFSSIDTDTNRQYISIFIPEYNKYEDNNNTKFIGAMEHGCCLIAMKLQYYDTNLDGYFDVFKKEGSYSFKNKPLELQAEKFDKKKELPEDTTQISSIASSTYDMSKEIESH